MDTSDPLKDNIIILFDGVCNLCNGFVQFVIRRDPDAVFRFASLQSDVGRKYLILHKLDPDALHSVIVIARGTLYQRSDAVLQIAKALPGFWSWLGVFNIVPRFIRDTIYNWVASSRYRWFGRRAECMLPDPSLKLRFLS
ncbi:thiol-disulfide oxidoreductase DCC family protein [Chryseolinea sp. T2]|uniref:thiol-disulfide oxidoreductase DCC family protein n=1 Tax=Chryseolinea sp. T2 TaxID=3129255 RepID=UPI003077121B